MAELDEFQKLEQALIEAGRAIDYPPTPSLAARVRANLTGEQRHGQRWQLDRPARRWQPALIIALAILAAIALLLIIPETREVIAQWLGLRTIRIIEMTPTPTPPLLSPTAFPQAEVPVTATSIATLAQTTPGPSPTPAVAPFKQCCPSTLEEAQQKARFKILLPPGKTPSRVFFQDQVFGRGSGAQQAVLVFGDPARPRFVLYQATQFLYGKMIPRDSGTVITDTQVSDYHALWLTGAPHVLVTLDQNGEPQLDFERPVNANTLIWETGDFDTGVTYRLETAASLEEAIAFAESLR
jgi:hypothetical protein